VGGIFGFLGASANKVGMADTTAPTGFPRMETLWGIIGASTGLESTDTESSRKNNRAANKSQVAYQTAHVVYANWPCTIFDFLGATADEVGMADVTALAGFTRIKVDLSLWGMIEASTGLESTNTERPRKKK
jgi:hypothetical protein